METSLKRLTFVAPREVETALVEALLAVEPPMPGFTTLAAAGHGESFDDANIRERVRGRVDRALLWIVMPAERVAPLLDQLERVLPTAEIVWFLEPVEAIGRLK